MGSLIFYIKGRYNAGSVEQLVTFATDWVSQSREIDQEGYKKTCLKDTEEGVRIDCIFFPTFTGKVNKNVLQQKFVLAMMKASERLGLSLSPNCLVQQSDAPPQRQIDLQGLMPS